MENKNRIPCQILPAIGGLILTFVFSLQNWVSIGILKEAKDWFFGFTKTFTSDVNFNVFSFFKGMDFLRLFNMTSDGYGIKSFILLLITVAILFIGSFLLVAASVVVYTTKVSDSLLHVGYSVIRKRRIASVLTYVGFGLNSLITILFILVILGINQSIGDSTEGLLSSTFSLTIFPFLNILTSISAMIVYSKMNKKEPDTVIEEKKGSITCVSGTYQNATFPIEAGEELIIGRDPALANVVLSDNAEKVSRKHCGIFFDPESEMYIVIDYSSNGIFKPDGTRLLANTPFELSRGTRIDMGSKENSFILN